MKYSTLIIWSVLLAIFLPRGMGFHTSANVILDVNKSLFLLSVVLSVVFFLENRGRLRNILLQNMILVALVLSPLPFFIYWKSLPEDLFIYISYILFYFSLYLVGEVIFSNEDLVVRFLDRLIVISIIAGLVGLSDYCFNWISLDAIRGFDEFEMNFEYTRGLDDVLGYSYISYTGNDITPTAFATTRCLTFSIILGALVTKGKWPYRISRKWYLIALALSFLEIVLTQCRAVILLSIFLLLYYGIFYFDRRMRRKAVLLILFTIPALYSFPQKAVSYVVANLVSLFTTFFAPEHGAWTIQITGMYQRFEQYELLPKILQSEPFRYLVGYGPLFYRNDLDILGYNSEVFADSNVFLHLIMEFGIPFFLLFMLLCMVSYRRATSRDGGVAKIMLFAAIFSMMGSVFVRNYGLIFFAIGACVGCHRWLDVGRAFSRSRPFPGVLQR